MLTFVREKPKPSFCDALQSLILLKEVSEHRSGETGSSLNMVQSFPLPAHSGEDEIFGRQGNLSRSQ